jgi:stringent starvation protein B
MPLLPRKKAVALDLLERTSVFVHLDPRRPGVIVPPGFMKQPQLVLQIGLNMAIAIPDLDVNEEGISCTLSFNKRPHFCSLPWSAVYALIGEQGGGMVWPEDVPPEVVSQQQSAAKKETRQRRPGLRAVGTDPADRKETEPAPVRSQRAEGPQPEPSRRENGAAAARPASSRPPRLVQVVSKPQLSNAVLPKAVLPKAELPKAELPKAESSKLESSKGEAPKSEPAKSEPAAARADETLRPQKEDANSRSPKDDSAASKRARPPYLRLVD